MPAGTTTAIPSKTPRGRGRALLRRMRRDSRKGSAAVEFAFVAPPFFVLLFAIIETGLIFFAQATLKDALLVEARKVKTGQTQTGNVTQTQFFNNVCNRIKPLLNCSYLQIDMRSYSGFSGNAYGAPLDSNGNLKTGQNNFQTGAAGDVVLVRAFYTWKVLTPVLTPFLANMAGNNRLLTAASAFRNEPYTQ